MIFMKPLGIAWFDSASREGFVSIAAHHPWALHLHSSSGKWPMEHLDAVAHIYVTCVEAKRPITRG
jgi:hypothetical protein